MEKLLCNDFKFYSHGTILYFNNQNLLFLNSKQVSQGLLPVLNMVFLYIPPDSQYCRKLAISGFTPVFWNLTLSW